MTVLDQMLAANHEFMKHLPPEYACPTKQVCKYPKRQIAIITCMDTRLVDFLEPALGIARGEAKMIKTAGNSITGVFSETIRSLLVCIFELGVKEIFVIGHEDCGMMHSTSQSLIENMTARGISPDAIAMIKTELEHWTDGFEHPVENVLDAVHKIKANPLMPKDVAVHGLIVHPHSGEAEVLVNGYDA
jgi:carbonic anhydrase